MGAAMTPDREQDQHEVMAEYRRRWCDRPDRLELLDRAATGALIFQQIWRPETVEIDMAALACGRAPALVIIDDLAGLGPSAWAAARDARAWARVAVIAAGEIEAEMLIEAAGEFRRVLAIETTRAAMALWSRYLAERMHVGVIDGDNRGFIAGTIH